MVGQVQNKSYKTLINVNKTRSLFRRLTCESCGWLTDSHRLDLVIYLSLKKEQKNYNVLLASLHHITHRYNHYASRVYFFYIFWLQRKVSKAKYVIFTSESIKTCHVEIKKISPPLCAVGRRKNKFLPKEENLRATWTPCCVIHLYNKVVITVCAWGNKVEESRANNFKQRQTVSN